MDSEVLLFTVVFELVCRRHVSLLRPELVGF